jgi:hypothetical protein
MADKKYCKNCGAPLSNDDESLPSEPKGYFPLLRQSGMPSPHDKTTDKHLVAVMATLAAFGIIMSVFVFLTADLSSELSKYEGLIPGNVVVSSFTKSGGDLFSSVKSYNGTISYTAGNRTYIASKTYTLVGSSEQATKLFQDAAAKKTNSEGFAIVSGNDTMWNGVKDNGLNATIRIGYDTKLGNFIVVSTTNEGATAILPTPTPTPLPPKPTSDPCKAPIDCSENCSTYKL